MQNSLEKFSKLINYHFNDESLLTTALTHRSANNNHNERLEFLGDAVLGLIISTAIIEKFPRANEGELSRLRASLVKGATLSEVAAELSLGDWIYLGSGELKSGGFRRESILADTLEAVFGAVYVDGGFNCAQDVVLNLFTSRLENVDPARLRKDPKTELQEYLQAQGKSLPEYEVLETLGKSHQQMFKVLCQISAYDLATTGNGLSRRKAEQDAAKLALDKILVKNHV